MEGFKMTDATSDNSGHTATLRSAQIAKPTSYVHKTLYDIPPPRRIGKYKNSRMIVSYGG